MELYSVQIGLFDSTHFFFLLPIISLLLFLVLNAETMSEQEMLYNSDLLKKTAVNL